jgi:hypothetical protein
MGRIGLAFKTFFAVLCNREKADKIRAVLLGAPSEGIQLLSVLQREGRLIDFFQEDISRYSDAQIGAAVRTVHAGCRKVLEENLVIEAIQKEEEGGSVTIEEGFDPSAIKLTGHVFGNPPFTGILRHHGWKATEIKFPEVPKGQDPTIIAPAEVEILKPPEENEKK